jgi:GntR family transcriptional repressor for pyruvate dehydrogenase complex
MILPPPHAMFEPVHRSDRLSDKVAQQLLESIVSQRLHAGSRLPSERELGEQFGVSRTVVREAVRHLAAKGVLEVRSGSGVRVAGLDAATVSESMRLFLRWSGFDYGQINEVRLTLELQTARLAALRATPDDVDALVASCDRLEGLAESGGGIEEVAVEDVEFHRIIARATHNPLYLVLLDSIGDVLLEIRRATVGIPGRQELAVEHHRRVADRVAARDEAGAEAAMREHLEEADEAWRGLGRAGPGSAEPAAEPDGATP